MIFVQNSTLNPTNAVIIKKASSIPASSAQVLDAYTGVAPVQMRSIGGLC
jgi:hypothetical protein